MNKPLVFRNERYGSGEFAQRDKIRYEIIYSHCYNGNATEFQYHVALWDIENADYISTENVKRFLSPQEAKQYCQDIYENKIDISILKLEIQADMEERKRVKDKIDHDGARKFKDILQKKGITLSVYFEIAELWNNTNHTSQSMLYKEVEKKES